MRLAFNRVTYKSIVQTIDIGEVLEMGCNAHNHPPDCDCGWGGDTGSYGITDRPSLSGVLGQMGFASIDSITSPNARCPVCGDQVYFYRSSDGGSVYFDELGPPWPKHPCMDNGQEFRGDTLSFFADNGVDMKPEQAMKLAAELVQYAMTDFREPNRKWPETEVLEARSELLKWMFRRHSTGEDYLIPLSEFLQVIGYLEKSAASSIRMLELLPELEDITGKEKPEEELIERKERLAKLQGTLSLASQFRAHYERESHVEIGKIRLIETLGDGN